MAQLTIQLLPPRPGGQQVFRVALVSDEDATPREHEQQHRRLVSRLFPGLDLDGGDAPRVEIDRERPAAEPSLGCSGGDGYEVIDLG
jgi:hypothetical protein